MGKRGHRHRTQGNECSPIISTVTGLWISASMEEQSIPGKWAQQGVQHPPAPAQNASTEYLCPHTLLQAPHAPSPQLSIPLQMSLKATPPWEHWPGGAASHLLGAKLLPSLSPGQGKGTVPSQPQSQEAPRKLPVRRQLQLLLLALGESRAGCTRKRNRQGFLPTARSAFPCWRKLRHRQRLCHAAE